MIKKYNLVIIILFFCACSTSRQERNEATNYQKVAENFDKFYISFYSDTIFQNERILKPLAGEILSWSEDEIISETWDNKEIIVTPKEAFLSIYNNLVVEFEKTDTLIIERYFIPHSGFEIKRKFALRYGQWFLLCYDISNI